MRRTLSFPSETKVEWKSHDSSIQQRTAIEESRREKANNRDHNQGDKRTTNRQQQQTDSRPQPLNT